MNPKIFILLGRAGCGKGTQADLLVQKFGFFYIGSGDLLRERAKKSDFTGKKIDMQLKAGNLAPSTLLFYLWMRRLEEIKNNRGDDFTGIIFDGSPRRLVEAELLDEALGWYDWQNIKAMLIDISRQESFARLTKRRICQQCGNLIPYVGVYKDITSCDKCGGKLEVRPDDTPEIINVRLDWYESDVLPVVDFYRQGGALIEVNGDQPIEDVQKEILDKIE
jgi:adenylate kinase